MKKLQKTILLMLALTLGCTAAEGRRKTSRALRTANTAQMSAAATCDTIRNADSLVMLTGYEKPLRDNKESLFVLNRGDRMIDCIILQITYYDMAGNMLHRRQVTKPLSLHRGERRRIDFSSWDTHRTFYYHLTPPARALTTATPYTVTLSVPVLTLR